PMRPFLDLLFAFEQDQLVTRYRTWEQLLAYCRGSADPVGRIVLHLFETFDDEKAAYSDRICTGLQLANHWQDVSEDVDRGRVYLPREDTDRFGVAEADVLARRFTPAFADLLRELVERTRDLFYAGYPLVPLLPPRYRGQVELFVGGGLAILRG